MGNRQWKSRWFACGVWFVCLVAIRNTESANAPHDVSSRQQARHPVALVRRGDALLVGNRRSGTISVIDAVKHVVQAEYVVAAAVADMASLSDTSGLLVVDDQRNQLLRVVLRPGDVVVKPLAILPRGATKLVFDSQHREVFISCRWDHRVVALELDASGQHVLQQRRIDVPFVPQELLLLKDQPTLIVADAFGNRLAVVDVASGEVQCVRRIDGHNIRGLALSSDGRQLHVAHQRMARHGRADYEELHWGRLISNAVEVFELDSWLDSDPDSVVRGWMDAQGGIGDATGDPGGVLTGPNGLSATTFAGMGEVAVRYGNYVKRLPVKTRPEAMASDRRHLYVANRFDDSVSVIDLSRGEVLQTIVLGPRAELNAIDRGERLFFNARLSHDAWISCHSCHTDGHSSGLLVDTLGDGDYGAPKRVPSLLGTAGTAPWGWTGQVQTLREQVRKSVTTTMHGSRLSENQATDLVAYLRSLRMPEPPAKQNKKLIKLGRGVFEQRGCVRCHAGNGLTSSGTYDVGLTDERGRKKFNPPSLRGLGHRGAFFHDARVQRLEDVIHRVKHMLDDPLNADESQALLAYLRSL